MILKIKSALEVAGFKVEIEVDAPFGKNLDIDVLAYRDGLLLALECKHVYHPCNMHELRNTLWHIKKGSDQLSIRLPYLHNKENVQKLLNKVGWLDAHVDKVRGAIVTSTRVLHGWRPEGYPVIQAKEFMNVLTRGVIVGPEGSFHLWENETLSIVDVENYLDGSIFIEDQLNCMIPIMENHPFNTQKLIFETWQFDGKGHGDRLAKKYRFTKHPTDQTTQ
jgi:hypothetical protein